MTAGAVEQLERSPVRLSRAAGDLYSLEMMLLNPAKRP